MFVSRSNNYQLINRPPPVFDLDLDRVLDVRIHETRRERGVTPRRGVEGRDSHEPVHAAFAFQIAIGVFALDLQGGA